MDRISNVSEQDQALLDDDFMEYLRKNNSRLYLFAENVRNNPLRFLLLFSAALLVLWPYWHMKLESFTYLLLKISPSSKIPTIIIQNQGLVNSSLMGS
ncbi:MAG: hypothetical protein U5N58_12060 [Actinomycetota bacterium]|nr:hypothetical protein [Actinomycetota bacterium]